MDYNTYDSKLSGGQTNGSDGNGAVLRIDPGATALPLAVASNAGNCYRVPRSGGSMSTAIAITTPPSGATTLAPSTT